MSQKFFLCKNQFRYNFHLYCYVVLADLVEQQFMVLALWRNSIWDLTNNYLMLNYVSGTCILFLNV